jgi:hypothetical protein
MAYETSTATDEQELALKLKTFLVNECSWTLLDTVTESASDKDYVFFIQGTQGRRDLYIRFRGYSNYLYVFGYTHWVDSGTYSDQMHNTTNSRAAASASPLTYWFIGNATRVIVIIKSGTAYHSMYAGHITSYYSTDYDDLPLCIIGHTSESSSLTSARALMYVPFTLASGTSDYYHSSSDIITTVLQYGSPNVRDASIAMFPAVMYCDTAGYYEARGELDGWHWASGAGVASETFITISGTSDKFLVIKHASSNTNTYCYGPIPV